MACRPPVTWGETEAENPEKPSGRPVGDQQKLPCLPDFAHPKNLFFHFFFKFSRFQPKFKTKRRSFDWCQQTRNFAPNVFQTDEGRVPYKERYGRTKNNVLFCSCDDVIKPNEIKLRPCAPPCGSSFLWKRFFKLVYPFQRYCLKTVSSAHRPTL